MSRTTSADPAPSAVKPRPGAFPAPTVEPGLNDCRSAALTGRRTAGPPAARGAAVRQSAGAPAHPPTPLLQPGLGANPVCRTPTPALCWGTTPPQLPNSAVGAESTSPSTERGEVHSPNSASLRRTVLTSGARSSPSNRPNSPGACPVNCSGDLMRSSAMKARVSSTDRRPKKPLRSAPNTCCPTSMSPWSSSAGRASNTPAPGTASAA